MYIPVITCIFNPCTDTAGLVINVIVMHINFIAFTKPEKLSEGEVSRL